MDIESNNLLLVEIKHLIRTEDMDIWNYKNELTTLIDAVIKKETTGCRYCRGIESHGIVAVKTVIDEYLRVIPAYDTPYNYCPNCGRKIKEDD